MHLGESEYAAIQKLHALVNHPGTISGGYNTLEFDDRFLRFSYYSTQVRIIVFALKELP